MVSDVKTMEVKKTQQEASIVSKETPAASKKVQAESFISEIKAEIKRITWTSPEELRVYTKIVVGTTFVFGMGIYFVDLLIQTSLELLSSVINLIS